MVLGGLVVSGGGVVVCGDVVVGGDVAKMKKKARLVEYWCSKSQRSVWKHIVTPH